MRPLADGAGVRRGNPFVSYLAASAGRLTPLVPGRNVSRRAAMSTDAADTGDPGLKRVIERPQSVGSLIVRTIIEEGLR